MALNGIRLPGHGNTGATRGASPRTGGPPVTERLHPLDALAEALVTVAYRESRLKTERVWAEELRRLEALTEKSDADRTSPRREVPQAGS